MSKASGFKEATFVEGRLVRISKRKVEIESEDEEDGTPSLLTVRLGDNVNIDLDTIGEHVRAVIVDGKVARITALGSKPVTKPRVRPREEGYEASGSSRELGTDLAG